MLRNKRLLILDLLFLALAGACLLALSGQADALFFSLVTRLTGKHPQPSWPGHLRDFAQAAMLAGALMWAVLRWLIPYRRPLRRWLERAWHLRDGLPEPQACPARWRFGWPDVLVLAIFLLWGSILFLDKIQGPYPYIKQPSDAGNIAGFAAAIRSPELFAGDELLADPANLRSYTTVNIPILNLFEQLAGNYALAFSWFIIPQTFLNLAGFYLLGMLLFRSQPLARRRGWACLLTLVLALPYEINLLETWGIVADPVTRFTFQALLPYLLALVLLWCDRPRLWPLIAALAGLMAFIHPVSTPAWAAAIWLGLLALLPPGWNLRRKALVMLGLGAVTAATLAPYALQYLGAGGPRPALSYDLFLYVIIEHFPPNILDIPAALGEFLLVTAASGLLEVGLALLGVLLWLHWRPGSPDRRRLRLALYWLGGILLVSLLVPWVEHSIEQAMHIVPLETELVRGLRYVVFFLLLFSVWGLAELDRRLAGTRWRRYPSLAALVLAAGWLLASDARVVVPDQLAACLSQGRVLCVHFDDEDLVLQAIRERTPPGAPVFATFADWGTMSYSMPIRYLALRPLVFAYKDRGQLVTARSPALGEWYQRLLIMNRINNPDRSDEERMAAFIPIARRWGAQYLLANFKVSPQQIQAQGGAVVYENGTFLLIRLP